MKALTRNGRTLGERKNIRKIRFSAHFRLTYKYFVYGIKYLAEITFGLSLRFFKTFQMEQKMVSFCIMS